MGSAIFEAEVRKSLNDIEKNKALGDGQITLDMLLEAKDKIIKLITLLINECFSKLEFQMPRKTQK